MNERKRFLQTMNFRSVDRVPWWGWFWEETIERWYKEGLPKDVSPEDFFNFDHTENVGVKLVGKMQCVFEPYFEEKVLEETSEYKIYRRYDGVILKQFKGEKAENMPQWLDFPVKKRKDWDKIKTRINPYSPERFPSNWEEKVNRFKKRDFPLGLWAGSLYGWIRNWMGMEQLAFTFYDDPAWIKEMMDYIVEYCLTLLDKIFKDIIPDYIFLWEDMCYKSGPLISPKLVKEFMVPRYKELTSFMHENGIDIIFLDSDGNADELIPLWLEGGINGFSPIEVAAGMDPIKLRKKYGKNLLLSGGIDKRKLARGKNAIKKEVITKIPYLCNQGGYIPRCDHLVPPDVTFVNYKYYINLMKNVTLDPEKFLN